VTSAPLVKFAVSLVTGVAMSLTSGGTVNRTADQRGDGRWSQLRRSREAWGSGPNRP